MHVKYPSHADRKTFYLMASPRTATTRRQTNTTSKPAHSRSKNIKLLGADTQRAKGVKVANQRDIAVLVAAARRAVFSVIRQKTLLVASVEQTEAADEPAATLGSVVAHGAELGWCWVDLGFGVWEGEGC